MVICKFFLQGNCRFGSSCRFEHTYSSKYSYHASQAAAPQTQQTVGSVTDEQLVNQVRADVMSVLKGGQWVLSCYAPFKEKPILPGLVDISPEEARLLIYEAKASNVYDQAAVHMKNIEKEAQQKYEQLLQPTPAITMTLRQLYNGESVNSPFMTQSGFGSNNPATSVFRSAVQNTPFGGNANTFGSTTNPQNIFAQATQNVFGSPQQQASPFSAQSPDAAKSIFAQANSQSPQSVFQTQPADPAKSIFASASQQFFVCQPASPFGQQKPADPFSQQNPVDPFGHQKVDLFTQQKSSDPFGNTAFSQTSAQNVFQRSDQPTNAFGTANVFEQQNPNDDGIYSKMEELTESDLEAFKSADFKLGFIPEIAPPQALCS